MSLSDIDGQTLRAHGFTLEEIKYFSEMFIPGGEKAGEPQSPINLASETWKKTMAYRVKLIQGLRRAEGVDFGQSELDDIFDDYYSADSKRSPTDWLKKEYKQLNKPKDFLSAYTIAMERTKAIRKMAGYPK